MKDIGERTPSEEQLHRWSETGSNVRDVVKVLADYCLVLRAELNGDPCAEMPSKYAPIVAAFGELMIKKLEENDHKPGWMDCELSWLTDKLRDEVCELDDAACQEHPDRSAIGLEAADVANMALMIADVCGGLPVSDPRTPCRKCGQRGEFLRDGICSACGMKEMGFIEAPTGNFGTESKPLDFQA